MSQQRLVDKKPCVACKQEKAYSEFFKDDDEFCIQCHQIADEATDKKIRSATNKLRKQLEPIKYSESRKTIETDDGKYTEVTIKLKIENVQVLKSNAGE